MSLRWRNVRTRLLLVVLAVLAAALALTTLGFNLLFERATMRDANSFLRARAASERALLQLVDGRLVFGEVRPDAASDSHLWLFDRRGVLLEQPRLRSPADAVARSLAGGPKRFVDVQERDVRLYAAPVFVERRRAGTLVTGITLAPYEHAGRTALFGSLALAATMLVLVGLAVQWLLKSALRPVARMTEQAALWSENDLDRRFDLGVPHDELTQLGATLDGLLDRLAASLRHERRFSAELSHELRTPLSRLIAELELALRRERHPDEYRAALGVALRNAQHVSRIVETLLAAAQLEARPATGTSDAYEVAVDALEEAAAGPDGERLELVVERPAAPLRLGLDAALAERVLQPVLENACRYGSSYVHVALDQRGGRVVYLVDDDGPGIAPDERETIFQPGVRGRAASGAEGAGLGLALARRLARASSGDVEVAENGRGARFVVALPAASATT
jgi:two-component system OmpR family sensor kinase